MPEVHNPSAQAVLSRTAFLTAADLLALGTTPFQLVPAPGAGMIIGLQEIAFTYIFGTKPFESDAGAVRVRYAGDATVGLIDVAGIINQLIGAQSSFLFKSAFMSAAATILPGDDNKAVVIDGLGLNAGPVGTATLGAGGAGYLANDTGTLTDGNGDATYRVLTVGGGGAVLTFLITAPGTGYTVGNGQATAPGGAQPGVGAGFTVNITAVQKGDGTLKVTTYYSINPVP
jgi:hypothetical protein